MTPSEAAELLGMIHLFDNRNASEERAIAWADLLADVSLSDAVDAVKHHFATNTDPSNYFVPAHVLAFVKRRRLARIDAFGAAARMPAPERIARLVDSDDGTVHMADRRLLLALVADGTVTPDMAEDEIVAVVARHQPRQLEGGAGRG